MIRRSSTARGRVVIALILLAIGAITLSPASGPSTAGLCFLCADHGTADAIRNIALFVPLGAAALLATGRPVSAAGAAALFSLVLELAQVLIPGRDASAGDWVFNTLGAVLGVLIACRWHQWIAPEARTAKRLAAAAAAGVVITIGLTALVLETDLPEATYYGQWTPELGHFEFYRGRLLDAKIGKQPVPSRQLQDSREIQRLIRMGAPVSVQGVAGPPPTALAPIFSIFDDTQREVLLLGAERRMLGYRVRTRAAGLRLETPTLWYPGGLAGVEAGDTLAIRVTRSGDERCISVGASGSSRTILRKRCGIGYTVASGWQLLVPAGLGSRAATLFDNLWLWTLFLPLGFWIRPSGTSVFLLAAAALGLALIPLFTPLVATPAASFATAGIGVATGYLLHRLSRRTG